MKRNLKKLDKILEIINKNNQESYSENTRDIISDDATTEKALTDRENIKKIKIEIKHRKKIKKRIRN